jgi:hypothetical protein
MIRLLFLCAVSLISLTQLRAQVDVEHMADVLPLKEVGLGWNGQPGPAGELSDWQITRGVWDYHMAPAPFSQARNPAQARACAVKHIKWLAQQIERRGLAVTPQRVATCWHYGLSHAARRSQWGLEVANLYHDLPVTPCPR